MKGKCKHQNGIWCNLGDHKCYDYEACALLIFGVCEDYEEKED